MQNAAASFRQMSRTETNRQVEHRKEQQGLGFWDLLGFDASGSRISGPWQERSIKSSRLENGGLPEREHHKLCGRLTITALGLGGG